MDRKLPILLQASGRMRHRLPFTRLFLVALIPLFLFSHHPYLEGRFTDTLLGSLGLTFLLAAAAGRIWASLYISGRKDRELVTDGPYSLVRHPLYLFSLLGFVGAGLAFESLTLAALMGTIFALGHIPAVRREEARLEELFGDEYREYRRRIPAFIPGLGPICCPGSVRVQTPLFLRSMREAALIPMIFVVAEALEWAKISEVLPVLVTLP